MSSVTPSPPPSVHSGNQSNRIISQREASQLILESPKKCMLIKGRVGISKLSTYDLPNKNFVYGSPHVQVAQGAGEIISAWVTAEPSKKRDYDKMTVATNILAIKNGCITSKAMHLYGKAHTTLRRKELLTNDTQRQNNESRFEGPFGRKTEFAEESMMSILQADYTNYDNEDAEYPDISTLAKKRQLKPSKGTIASEGPKRYREIQEVNNEMSQKHFTMSKFKNVKSTTEKAKNKENVNNSDN